MKVFENIGKRMPFSESEDYVRQLVDNATEKALQQPKAKTVSMHKMLAAAAVIIVLLAGIGITYFDKIATNDSLTAKHSEAPIEQFLNGLTDDEVQLLAYYDIEEIPEEQSY